MSSKKAKKEFNATEGYFDGMRFHRHMRNTIGRLTIDCPAKMDFRRDKLEQCTTESGELIYALPGGGEITESGVIL